MIVEKPVRPTEIVERKGVGYKPLDDMDFDFAEEMEGYERNQRLIKLLVQQIIEGWDPASNNDALLTLEFWRTKFEDIEVTSSKDMIIYKIPKSIIRQLNAPESISRARRTLNVKGLCLPTNDKVYLRRMKRQKVLQKYYGGKDGNN